MLRKLLFLLVSLLVTSACTQTPPRGLGSVLIIAVTDFRGDDLNCNVAGDSLTPQIDTICNESVRFTHAYTPSALAIPALASIFTGIYPAEHGVHRNGASRYFMGGKSLPEKAEESGYQTFFVSGGAPALRKTAISKGFIDFDDGIRQNGSFYRKATDTLKKLESYVETRSDSTPFLAVAELADLSFPEIVSFEASQEAGTNAKLQEIDEALGNLRKALIRLKIWDALTVVVVGLQGTEHAEHGGLSKGLSLYDEIVRVPLLIKPSRKPRDQGPAWKVDEPVTLVDLGKTLNNLMDFKEQQSQMPVVDFSKALDAKQLEVKERPIFAESDLPPWRGWGPRIISVRQGEKVEWLPPESRLFNTYTDHLELRNLFSIDSSAVMQMDQVIAQYASEIDDGGERSGFMATSVAEKLRVAKIIFSKATLLDEKLRNLVELEIRRPEDWQVVQWHVSLLVTEQAWVKLRDLLSTHLVHRPKGSLEQNEFKLWQLFTHLKLKSKIKTVDFRSGPLADCLYLGSGLKRFNFNELDYLQGQQGCKDLETQDWVMAYSHARLKHAKEASAFFDLAKALTEKRVEQNEFARAFWINGATWDYNPALPDGPAPLDLFLSLEETHDFADFTKKKQFP